MVLKDSYHVNIDTFEQASDVGACGSVAQFVDGLQVVGGRFAAGVLLIQELERKCILCLTTIPLLSANWSGEEQ